MKDMPPFATGMVILRGYAEAMNQFKPARSPDGRSQDGYGTELFADPADTPLTVGGARAIVRR
ncbi:MAG: hypothetical protein Q4F18_04250 [Clostridia bacterium]|nr:hypothetical protein [Clostridia bacterium]